MKINVYLRNLVVDTIVAACDTTAEFYSGSMPASADTAPTGTLLIKCFFETGSAFTWGTPDGGVSTLDTSGIINASTVATVDGTIGYVMMGTGSSRVYCTVGTSGAEFTLPALDIKIGESLNRFSGTISLP